MMNNRKSLEWNMRNLFRGTFLHMSKVVMESNMPSLVQVSVDNWLSHRLEPWDPSMIQTPTHMETSQTMGAQKIGVLVESQKTKWMELGRIPKCTQCLNFLRWFQRWFRAPECAACLWWFSPARRLFQWQANPPGRLIQKDTAGWNLEHAPQVGSSHLGNVIGFARFRTCTCLVPVRGRVAVGAAPAAVVHNSVASSFFIYLYLILSLRLSILVFHSFLCSNRIKQAFLKAMSASPAENCRTHPGLRLIFRLGGLLLLAGTRHWTSIQGIASCPGKLFCNILSKRLNQKLPSNICQTLRGSISSTPRASTKGWFNASEIVGRSAGSLISLASSFSIRAAKVIQKMNKFLVCLYAGMPFIIGAIMKDPSSWHARQQIAAEGFCPCVAG